MTCRFPFNSSFAGLLFVIVLLLNAAEGISQECTAAGQTPNTATPICGTTSFSRSKPNSCRNRNLFVPGCSSGFALSDYLDKNPYWFSFTCVTAGTLGFEIIPYGLEEDYDWQVFDITGKNPDDVYTDSTIVVSGNWAGAYGKTGAIHPEGFEFICASEDQRYCKMPVLIEGHDYLMVVTSFYENQLGFSLTYQGGDAVIGNSRVPHIKAVSQDCYDKLTVKLDKKLTCSSLTATGSEFSLSNGAATITAAVAGNCTLSPFFDEVTLTLSNTLSPGSYQLIINNGTDANTLVDNCGHDIPAGEQTTFEYKIPGPIYADSIAVPGCSPSEITVYFPKNIDCSTVAADGTDFAVSGPSPVTVTGAEGNCTGGFAKTVKLRFAGSLITRGDYELRLKTGSDGSGIIDQCGFEMPFQTLPFHIAGSVVADIDYTAVLGCRINSFTFSAADAGNATNWIWQFNESPPVSGRTKTVEFPATSNNNINLIASNGVCSDTASETITTTNETIAGFNVPAEICPGTSLSVVNNSTGDIDNWQWKFGLTGESNVKDPAPYNIPFSAGQSRFPVQLKVINNTIGCSDSIIKFIEVRGSCTIAVPSAFTPNGDGRNDYLGPINSEIATEVEFKIYNRWGQLVFSTKRPGEKWNGIMNGIAQPAGIFIWMLNYTDPVSKIKLFQKGTSMLIR